MKSIQFIFHTFCLLCSSFIMSSCTKKPIVVTETNNEKSNIVKLSSGNTTVDFDTPIFVDGIIAQHSFSGTISTYGSTAIGYPAGTTQSSRLKKLALKIYRIPLKWNNGTVISSATGGPTDVTGYEWIDAINNINGISMVVIGGSNNDNDITPTGAASMVRYFKAGNKPVKYWIVGNEPDNNNSNINIDDLCARYNVIVDSMKAVDPSIKVGGPAWSHYNRDILQRFIQLSGSRTDILDYHHYGMGTTWLSNSKVLEETINWENEVNELRYMIKTTLPGAERKIEIQVGEYNWSWRTANGYPGWNGDDRFFESVATVWNASIAGHIYKAGGRGHQYSDLNGALGLTFEQATDAAHFGRSVNDPMPGYYGLMMFTGGNLFRSFGQYAATASTSLSNVEIYASTNRNIVMINKDSSNNKIAEINALGIDSIATVDVWQTSNNAPFSPPAKVDSLTSVNNIFTYSLPPYTVTTFIVNGSKNLALNATATASGFTNEKESPDKAKDGNTNTKWCDNVNRDKWLKYDLGSLCTIKRFVLNWEDWDINSKYKIQISLDGNTWSDAITETNNLKDPRAYSVNIPNVRYVRLFVSAQDDDAVRLMEFEVWGSK